MKGKLAFSVFASFWIASALLSIAAVLKKQSLPEGALRFGVFLHFGSFLVCMSAVEIYAGEIRTRFHGPPLSSRKDSPRQFWLQIAVQLALGAVFLAALF